MRNQLVKWVTNYPADPLPRDPAYKNTPLGEVVKRQIPAAIRGAVPEAAGLRVKGGIGEGRWTDTPWVALLDPKMAVEDGVYVVYLLSRGGERLYLTIAQGVTGLYYSLGKRAADRELRRRADLMRPFVAGQTSRLTNLMMDLASRSWRGPLYEASAVVGTEYPADNLPVEGELIADLTEAIALYRLLTPIAVWQAESEMLRQALDERGISSFEEAKRYGHHRRIERKPSHSRKVKKVLGTRCMGCQVELSERYGPSAAGVIDAHHLTPLDTLDDGEVVQFDPAKDFAVLCPNCHRVIHRMPDPSDLRALRDLVLPYRSGGE